MARDPQLQESERHPLDPFPMMDGPPIPWFLAGIIYEHLYRYSGQTLERLAERGGFGWGEVKHLWRDNRHTTPERREIARRVARESLEKLRDAR